jgi:RNA polymerase sigma factor (TIGR02999 family)
MQSPSNHEITDLLLDWSGGDKDALEKLMPLVYGELRKTAAGYLRRERSDHTLQTAALVNEAYLRLVRQEQVGWRDRVHFFAIAAQMMRRILVDHARSRRYVKRGGDVIKLPLGHAMEVSTEAGIDVLVLDQALSTLAKQSARHARVIELRFFGGFTQEETAEALDLSPATVARCWRLAKAWLHRYLQQGMAEEI